MKNCFQTPTQNVLEHGISVRDHTFKLIEILEGKENLNYKIPNWFLKYKNEIIKKLLPIEIIEEYTTYHDCGKPYCKLIDNTGNQHFENHSEISSKIWLEIGGNQIAASCMRKDMAVHTISANEVEEFCKNPEAITLLIVALAEIHSNAELFGGIESTSFKIKYKKIDRRGNAICKKLFGEKYEK